MKINRQIIVDWVPKDARVLDLGCGEGDLLQELHQQKDVQGWGVDVNLKALQQCISKGIPALHQDVDTGMENFSDKQFDVVITVVSLQQFKKPLLVLDEMLRIGKECILVFPNFGYWRNRWYLMRRGQMPVSEDLPYQWYNTPNIHLFTVPDFRRVCGDKKIQVQDYKIMDRQGGECRIAPAWFGALAYFRLQRQ